MYQTNRQISIKTRSKFLGEKGKFNRGFFKQPPPSNAHHCIFCRSFAFRIHYQKVYSFVVVCITRKLLQQNMSMIKIINYRLKPSASHSFFSLCPNILFSSEKQVADKVADKRADGWASLDWREHVAYSRAGVARYCAML